MQYGIKLGSGDWMQFLSEYHNTPRALTFNTSESAELYAQDLELKNYVIEVYNDTKSTLRL